MLIFQLTRNLFQVRLISLPLQLLSLKYQFDVADRVFLPPGGYFVINGGLLSLCGLHLLALHIPVCLGH
jgi:hypothetical protein